MDGGIIQQALLMILNVVIAALVSALTALGVSYFRTRGQNLATKHDFHELQKQLKANTELVETIKSEVSQRDWAQREWTNLRRVKLEALLEKMHDCDLYLERRRSEAFEGKVWSVEPDPINELDVIAALYFREIKNEIDRFTFACRELTVSTAHFGKAVMAAVQSIDPAAQRVAFDTFEAKWDPRYKEFLRARYELTTAARSLLERIMNVDEDPAPSDAR